MVDGIFEIYKSCLAGFVSIFMHLPRNELVLNAVARRRLKRLYDWEPAHYPPTANAVTVADPMWKSREAGNDRISLCRPKT